MERWVAELNREPKRLEEAHEDRSAGAQARSFEAQLLSRKSWTLDEIRAQLPAARKLRDRLLEQKPQFDVVLLFCTWMAKLAEGAVAEMSRRAAASTPVLTEMNAILSQDELSDDDLKRLSEGADRLQSEGLGGDLGDPPTEEIQELRTSAIAMLVMGTSLRYYEDPAVRRKGWLALRKEQATGLDLSVAVPQLKENLEIEEEASLVRLGKAVLAEIAP